MSEQKRAYFYAFAAVLFWSTIASAFKISLRYLDVLSLLFYASFVSTAALFVHLIFSKKLSLLKSFSGRNYLHSALLGLLNPFLYYVILVKAYDILRAQEALTINWLWPVTLVLFSMPLLGQKIKVVSIVAIIISFAGVFIISSGGDILRFKFSSPAGVLLAISSTVIWSLYWIYNVKDKRDEIVRMFVNFAFGSVFIFVSLLLFAEIKIPCLNGIAGAVYIGLFEMGITFVLWLKALKLSETTAHVASLMYLTPFISLAIISFAVGEKIFFSTVIGLVFIVAGIILQKL